MSYQQQYDHQDSQQTLDLFSHDSTHVRLVMEAERQSDLARERATSILQKYSKDADNDKGNAQQNQATESRDEINQHTQYNPYNNSRLEDHANIEEENNNGKYDVIDSFLQHEKERRNEEDNDDASQEPEETAQNEMFEMMQDTSPVDMAHIAHCLLPLSPKGAPKNKAKRISGQFEFKRINGGALTVVKSASEDGSHYSFQSQHSKSSRRSKKSTSSKGSRKSKRKGFIRRLSFGSRSKCSMNTEDALIGASRSVSERVTKQEKNDIDNDAKTAKGPLTGTKTTPEKEKRAGDLPPKPRPPTRRVNSVAPSSKAEASDAGEEEVISVVSDISDLSLESVAQKARNRLKNGPIVLNEAMLSEARIPETICLKKQMKLTKIEKIKRKISFRKGNI